MYFFRKSRIRIFLEKGGYFGTPLREFEEKGVNFYVSVLLWKWRGTFGLKSQCLSTKKGVNFGLKCQCYITKKGSFWAEKSVFCHKKGVIFKLQNKDGYHFFQWVREPGVYMQPRACLPKLNLWELDIIYFLGCRIYWVWGGGIESVANLKGCIEFIVKPNRVLNLL